MEVIDPVRIPAKPVQKALMSVDLMNLSVWLIHSLIKELDVSNPKWRTSASIKPFLKTMTEWARSHPQGFPKFKTHVYKLFQDWDLEFGVMVPPDSSHYGAYNERRKIVILNSEKILPMLSSRQKELTIVEVLAHELRHAYDDLISKGQGLGPDQYTDYKGYLALPAEVRARFTQMEPELIQELYFASGEIKHDSYFRVIMPELMRKYELSVSDLRATQNPQKIYQKLIGKAWLLKQSMDVLSDDQRAKVIQALKSTQHMPAQSAAWWNKIKRILEVF
jgi:hypothetical protein